MKKQKLFWQILLWANWALIVFYWWQGSGMMLFESLAGFFIASGRIAGLAAAYSILLQFFFMGRMPWLERVFGLDKLSRIHHTNGQRGLIFLIFHPVLITLGYSRLSGLSFINQFITLNTQLHYVIWAFLAFVLFIISVGASLYIVRNKLKYETWYFVHLAVYIAIFASFWHQVNVGEDLIGQRLFYLYWVALYLVVFSSHITFRFIRPVFNLFRFQFRVERIQKETYNTTSVYISGKNLAKFPVQPGQFMIFRFLNKKMWWQAHPFSLSMLPDGKNIRITVKELGDFTNMISDLKPGTRIMIDGPYGVFTEIFSLQPKAVFIAGGIGITPVRSLMEKMLSNHKDVTLIYGNKTQKDIVFKNEFDQISQRYNAKISHVISDEPDYQGEKGRIDEEKIKRLVPDINSRDVYLCGPPPMMEGIISILNKIGVPSPQIHYEKFSL